MMIECSPAYPFRSPKFKAFSGVIDLVSTQKPSSGSIRRNSVRKLLFSDSQVARSESWAQNEIGPSARTSPVSYPIGVQRRSCCSGLSS